MSEQPTRFGNWFRTTSTALLIMIFALSGLSVSKSEAIKTEDNQAAVPDSPWRAVGKLYNGTGAGCTAIAVDADQLLTAAHCVFNRRTGLFLQPSSLHILLGLNGDDYLAHAIVERYVTGSAYAPGRSFATTFADWAVLRMKQPLPPEYRPVPLAIDMPEDGSPVLTGGYGQDRAFAISVDGNCRILQKIRGLLVHNCHTARGYSGAPLVRPASGTTPMQIVGIHVARGYFQGNKVNIAIPAAMIGQQRSGAHSPVPTIDRHVTPLAAESPRDTSRENRDIEQLDSAE